MFYRTKSGKNWVASVPDFQESFRDADGRLQTRSVVKRFVAPSRRLLAYYIAVEIHLQTRYQAFFEDFSNYPTENVDKLIDLLLELFD